MTTITKEGLKENLHVLTRFAYELNHEKWLKFCEKERNGKQDIGELSMLIQSITTVKPWRVIISSAKMEKITKVVADLFAEIQTRMDENEKIVSETV